MGIVQRSQMRKVTHKLPPKIVKPDPATQAELDRQKTHQEWYRPFAMFKGDIRVAKSSGKAHFYIKMKDGTEACVTHKFYRTGSGTYYFLHLPAYTSRSGEAFHDAEFLCEHLESKGAIYSDKVSK